MTKFKLGDRVICNGFADGKTIEGVAGKILDVYSTGYTVEFDENIGGHSDKGGKKGHVWNIGFKEGVKILSLEKDKTKVKFNFTPGMSIGEYVKNLLKTTKDKEQKKWLRTFSNCVLSENIRDQIEEALTIVLRRDKFEEWGIHEHFEKGITNSILLYGPPGTGKTMISESIAAVLGMNLMIVSSGDIQSPIPGATENNIKNSFSRAKSENAVVLLDECDSILSNRDSVGTILGAEINCLLTELERFDGVCILTTNRIHRLDPALERRIIAKVKLDNPNFEARTQIWQKLMPPKAPIEKGINYEDLAERELTGGEIKNVIILAVRKAIAKNQEMITIKNITDAIEYVTDAKIEFDKARPNPMSSSHNLYN